MGLGGRPGAGLLPAWRPSCYLLALWHEEPSVWEAPTEVQRTIYWFQQQSPVEAWETPLEGLQPPDAEQSWPWTGPSSWRGPMA